MKSQESVIGDRRKLDSREKRAQGRGPLHPRVQREARLAERTSGSDGSMLLEGAL